MLLKRNHPYSYAASTQQNSIMYRDLRARILLLPRTNDHHVSSFCNKKYKHIVMTEERATTTAKECIVLKVQPHWSSYSLTYDYKSGTFGILANNTKMYI